MKKAQISVEYLVVIGLTVAMLIVASLIFYNYTRTSGEKAIRAEINSVGNKIVTTAESVYGLGSGSMISLELNYPEQTTAMNIYDNAELVIISQLSTGETESIFFSDVPISGSNFFVHPGLNVIKVESLGSTVQITQLS